MALHHRLAALLCLYPLLPSSSSSSSSSSTTAATVHCLILGTTPQTKSPTFSCSPMFASPPPTCNGSPLTPLADDVPIPSVEITQIVRHEGVVNRARYMPQNSTLVATKMCGSEVHVFHCGHRTPRPSEGETGVSDLVLRGHATEGYGVSWSSLEGYLLSGTYDSKICSWDAGVTRKEKVLV